MENNSNENEFNNLTPKKTKDIYSLSSALSRLNSYELNHRHNMNLMERSSQNNRK